MKTKHAIITLTFAIPGLIACTGSSTQNGSENTSAPVDSSYTVEKSDNDPEEEEPIEYDDAYFPNDSTFTAKVLTVGFFHGDEVWESANKEKWLGLFKNKTGYYIAATQIKTKRVHDAIVDEHEHEKTGWNVKTENADTSVLLFEQVDFITPRGVQQAHLPRNKVWPGDTLHINYLGIDYYLFATGGKKKFQDDPEWFDVWNYKLYLSATINGKKQESLLIAQPNRNDYNIRLIFAGDIDGDGILDLIIDASRHYNVTSPTIYLSKPAVNGEIVVPFGGHTSVGC